VEISNRQCRNGTNVKAIGCPIFGWGNNQRKLFQGKILHLKKYVPKLLEIGKQN
jgi:hypothetical protein